MRERRLPGYRTMKRSWDDGSFCGGKLKQRNMKVGNIVGEVVDFISPSVDVKRIIDKYVEAIAVVETWGTEEQFVEAWENDVFGGEYNEMAGIRYVDFRLVTRYGGPCTEWVQPEYSLETLTNKQDMTPSTLGHYHTEI
jgi:hypothetical protein